MMLFSRIGQFRFMGESDNVAAGLFVQALDQVPNPPLAIAGIGVADGKEHPWFSCPLPLAQRRALRARVFAVLFSRCFRHRSLLECSSSSSSLIKWINRYFRFVG